MSNCSPRFPAHVVPILTSVVIECQRAKMPGEAAVPVFAWFLFFFSDVFEGIFGGEGVLLFDTFQGNCRLGKNWFGRGTLGAFQRFKD